eukprot:1533752-Heterocapsa_arctica.AAC.1
MPPPTLAMDYAHVGASVAMASGTIVYTDGSAVFPRDLPMRRAAYGVWVGHQPGKLCVGSAGKGPDGL